MTMTKRQSQKLKSFVRKLSQIRGRHTELVSVYVPSGYDLNKIIQHLQQEQGTANNIKDKNTRTNVIDSLEKMIRHLRLYKKTPENGLAVFSGNASKTDKTSIEVWSIEPPNSIQTRMYRCDQTFKLDILKEMLDVKETYGLIVMDNREANIGLLKGTSIKEIHKLTSGVPGKIKAGGQSQQRYARLREGAAKEFYKRISDVANKEFLNMGKNLKGLLIGGPGQTKNTFLDGNYLNNQVKEKVIGTRDLSYTGEYGLNELVEKGQDLLAKESITNEKKVVNMLLSFLAKEPEKVTYGENQVRKALDMNVVDTIIISECLDDAKIEELSEKAEKSKAQVEIISLETNEGIQLKELGGVAAILRYALHID